jgi:hypothetical protein
MKPSKRIGIGYPMLVSLLVCSSFGCGADPGDESDPLATDSVDNAATREASGPRRDWRFRYRHPRDPKPGDDTGGAAGSGGALGSGGETGSGGTSGAGAGGVGGAAGTGGAAGSGIAAGCEICAKANDCCNVVSGGPLCQYSAAACSSMSGTAQAAYINGCKTMLWTTSNAWKANPPSACR